MVHALGPQCGDSRHSTFSKNRHGRFRQSGVFREVFEEIVRRCVEVGLVEGETLAVDGTMVAADASQHSRIRREELKEAAQVSRTVQQYLAELEQANPVAEPALVSTADPDALLATKGGGSVRMAYYDNYLIDTASRVILEVEATPALFHQETVAARRMMERSEKLGLRPKNLAADKAYGSGEFLAWLMARVVEPHIPVMIVAIRPVDASPTTFRYEPAENAYYCPEGKALRYRGLKVKAQSYSYCSTEAQCQGCRRRSAAHQVPTARCLSTGTKQLGRPYALWWELQLTSGRVVPDTRLKHSLPSSSSEWDCGGCGCADCGTSPNSF